MFLYILLFSFLYHILVYSVENDTIFSSLTSLLGENIIGIIFYSNGHTILVHMISIFLLFFVAKSLIEKNSFQKKLRVKAVYTLYVIIYTKLKYLHNIFVRYIYRKIFSFFKISKIFKKKIIQYYLPISKIMFNKKNNEKLNIFNNTLRKVCSERYNSFFFFRNFLCNNSLSTIVVFK